MSGADNYGSTLDPQAEQTSLVGPAHAPADSHDPQGGQVGIPPLTPEEQETIKKQLLAQEKLGLYTNAALLAGVTDPEDANRQNPVKSKSGVWLQPGDPDYIAAREAIEKQGVPNNVALPDDGKPAAGDKIVASDDALDRKTHDETRDKKDAEQERALRQDTVDHIKTMVAVNEGSNQKHDIIDQAALQRLRQGASTMELKDLQGKLAAVNGFTLAGQAEDIDPEKLGQIHPSARVTGPGADRAYALAQERKEKANEQFTAMMRKKQLGDSNA
jgi:hypothetical protein